MGVNKLTTFVKENIELKTYKWVINQEEYKSYFPYNKENNNSTTQKRERKVPGNSGDLKLIIDANAFLYYLGYKLNWFNFDIYLHLLLAIENLELLIFVFDGFDTNKKMVTLLSRFEDRVKGIKEFYNRITTAVPSKCHYFVPKKIFPTSLVKIAYAQYLFGAAKHYKKLKVIFSILEADADIANLAIKYNA
ncbi:hypothetical protein PIROE2DRAFT_3974 [Piromyces sp. E2]|nr:hypothetical protein PIROE2DRAFT_3974 [Piromyces sp. E2]|eukprot:OUM68374.1 hypothetical protein PIROE2DRAFT_3974 [Piromyces sp. E2]